MSKRAREEAIPLMAEEGPSYLTCLPLELYEVMFGPTLTLAPPRDKEAAPSKEAIAAVGNEWFNWFDSLSRVSKAGRALCNGLVVHLYEAPAAATTLASWCQTFDG